MSKVLVLDGNLNSSLAVIRSLGRQGIEVTVGAEVQPCLGGSSRYCTRHFVYPQPAQDSGQFIDLIFDEVRNSQYDFIFPMTDVTIPIILQHRHLFEKYTLTIAVKKMVKGIKNSTISLLTFSTP